MKIDKLIKAIDDSRTNLSDAIDELQDYLSPIIEFSGIGKFHAESIIEIYRYKDYYEITTEWSSRNCRNTSNYRIPVSILNSPDPIEAAKRWKIEEEQKKEAENRVKMERELKYLQEQLNKSGEKHGL